MLQTNAKTAGTTSKNGTSSEAKSGGEEIFEGSSGENSGQAAGSEELQVLPGDVKKSSLVPLEKQVYFKWENINYFIPAKDDEIEEYYKVQKEKAKKKYGDTIHDEDAKRESSYQ